jgi:hypothetical protein
VPDPPGLIIGEFDLQPITDLLRTPRRRPPPVLAVGLGPALLRRCPWSVDYRTVGPVDTSGQSLLQVTAKSVVANKPRLLGAPLAAQ